MQFLIITSATLFFLAMILNLYSGMLYFKLYQEGVFSSKRRVSFRILNDAVKQTNSKLTLAELAYCKKIYFAYVVLFYLSIILILTAMAILYCLN